MTEKWNQFESECAKYIENIYANEYNIKVIAIGGSNSNLNDIQIIKDNNLLFNMEIKSKIAQCGQFVVSLNPKTGCYDYGTSNQSEKNSHVDRILYEINSSSRYRINPGTYIEVGISDEVATDWIKSYYKSKRVKYFITEFNTQKVILHIDNFEKYFKVTCVLRPKYSGSGEVSKNKIDKLYEALSENFQQHSISFTDLSYEKNKRMILKHNCDLLSEGVSKEKFISNDSLFRFQLERENKNSYYIRQLSTTKNLTVIFTIESILSQRVEDLNSFTSNLR